jgi:hypothetical protein
MSQSKPHSSPPKPPPPPSPLLPPSTASTSRPTRCAAAFVHTQCVPPQSAAMPQPHAIHPQQVGSMGPVRPRARMGCRHSSPPSCLRSPPPPPHPSDRGHKGPTHLPAPTTSHAHFHLPCQGVIAQASQDQRSQQLRPSTPQPPPPSALPFYVSAPKWCAIRVGAHPPAAKCAPFTVCAVPREPSPTVPSATGEG